MATVPLLLWIVSLPLWAAPLPESITVSSNHTTRYPNTDSINASGNVIVTFKNYQLTSDTFQYYGDQSQLTLATPYQLTFANGYIHGNSGTFNIKNYTGNVTTVTAQVSRYIIKGELLELSPSRIVIKNALYTTCHIIHHDITNADYYVRAKTLIIYPKLGFFIAFHSNLGTKYLPFSLYIPTYLYGAPQHGLLGSSSIFPHVGSNTVEGTYAKSQIPFAFKTHHQGTVDVGYLSKLGPWFGAQYRYTYSKSHHSILRGHIAGSDGLEGHFSHHWQLKKHFIPKTHLTIFDEFISKLSSSSVVLPQSQLSLTLQHRELVNFNRVSYLPLVTYQTNQTNITNTRWTVFTHSNIGTIQEEQIDTNAHLQSKRINTNGTLSRQWQLPDHWSLNTSIHFKGFWYGTEDHWIRFFNTLSLHKRGLLNPTLSYTKHLIPIQGHGLFEFERRYAIESDEVGAKLSQYFGPVLLEAEGFMNLDTEQLRSANLTAGYRFHCWQLTGTWESVQQSFKVGLSLF